MRNGSISIFSIFVALSIVFGGIQSASASDVYSIGQTPKRFIHGADLDGDSYLDVIVSRWNDAGDGAHGVGIFMNEGQVDPGVFTHDDSYDLRLNCAVTSLVDVDADDDGALDLAVTTMGACGGELAILLNDGTGAFPRPYYHIAIGEEASYIRSHELNGDGIDDLIIAIRGAPLDPGDYPAGVIEILTSNMSPDFFDPPVAYSLETGQEPMAFCLSDFDGDGNVDIATANKETNDVSVLHGSDVGTSDVSFSLAQTVKVGCGPVSIICADFDADGEVDLVVANEESGSFSHLINTEGSFDLVLDYPLAVNQVAFYPKALALAGDQAGDGYPDFFMAVYGPELAKYISYPSWYSVWSHDGSKFTRHSVGLVMLTEEIFSVAGGDFDSDQTREAAFGFRTGAEWVFADF